MNICLLGATGRVGSIILANALSDQHDVQALVRYPDKLSLNKDSRLSMIKGNALEESKIAQVIQGADVVVSALNTDGMSTLSDSMPLIIKNMKSEGIKRIVTIGSAGILQARSAPQLYRFQSTESKRKTTRDAEEHLRAYLILKESGLDWTIVCPTYLPLGERIGQYRYEKDVLPKNPSSISVYDTGDFAYQQLFREDFVGFRVGLTY
ncbi:NAD-dependent epimerase/dehydratase family protein [Bacillus salipaludis]|uniref:NAD-dependent epimerase/dehydratase family protein n=1 Tax=Bacillus salipaludis TaxID=2547811 RepID=A0A4R5VZU6_9BACI|nr:NAD(P)H-binding protein [Bacillus salipaludis]TDK65176.1 NAD-dependent epimerase/dehydratase family protein [Bacillus salipaludis]